MNGVSETCFDPNAQVNPKMVCTVTLRHLKLPETDWNYDTSVKKAQSIDLTGNANVSSAVITRGNAAIIIASAVGGSYTKTTGQTTPTPTTTPRAAAMTIEEMKAEIVRLTNEERVKAGLNPVEVLSELTDCAQAKADDMIENNYFKHDSPTYGTPTQMMKSFGINAKDCYENIASGAFGSPNVLVSLWMGSKVHHDNILNPKHTHVGIGITFFKGNTAQDKITYVAVQQFVTIK
jgi:uncharacterized protein YkwD